MSLGDWLNDRIGHREPLRRLLDQPIPGGARLAYAWGGAIALLLLVEAITGALLMSAYAPSATTAWSSVAHINFTMRAGWLIRGVHYFGAQALIILVAIHVGHLALRRAYRAPHEVSWFLALGVLGVILGFAFTGNPLPWDQDGYWGARVETGIAGTVPVVGQFTQQLMVGGSSLGHLTLTRLYSLHVFVLPAVAALLLAARFALFRKHGVAPPDGAAPMRVDRFYPKQLGLILLVGVVALVVLFDLAAVEHGAPLESPADPISDYSARPAWYFRPLFELRKYFPGSLELIATVGVPGVCALYLFLLPFLDRKPASLLARLPALAPLFLIGLGAVGLLAKSVITDARDEGFQRAQAAVSERTARALALFKQGVPPEGALAMLRNDPETRGEDLYKKECASCHRLGDLGPPKDKMTAPDLTGFGTKAWALEVLRDPDADHLFGKTAFKEMMPSVVKPPADPEAAKMFTPMSEADQETIAAFLEGQARGELGAGTPGEKLVRQRCTSCHRLDGKTDDEESAAPELRGWASIAWIEAQITNPGSGKAYPPAAMSKELEGHMPAFEEKLSANDRKILAGWVYRHGRGEHTKAAAAKAPEKKP
ncbi:cytochrome B6 [Sorangium cellulosum]|uniref:Cytochrome B6 n=1 Tax=Sorangium cellulosum TaxID=56 RepID=A0A2L0EIX7_SORCE|nr:cytochrome b N-terminal domain-containing protein [Sorangium cellulosum]AUX39253.1 cytochrome B6 [Sorangium cellulosum]